MLCQGFLIGNHGLCVREVKDLAGAGAMDRRLEFVAGSPVDVIETIRPSLRILRSNAIIQAILLVLLSTMIAN
jgi:hypothetical protein